MWWYDISMKINEATFQGHPICLYLHYIDLFAGQYFGEHLQLGHVRTVRLFGRPIVLGPGWSCPSYFSFMFGTCWHPIIKRKEQCKCCISFLYVWMSAIRLLSCICHLKHDDYWSTPSWSSNRFRELVISEAWLLVLKRRLVDYTAGRPMGWQMTWVWTKMQPFPIQIWKSTGKGALKERDRERLQENLEKRYSELIYFKDCVPAVTQRLPLAVPNVAKVLRKRWLSWQCSKKVLAATWMHSSPPECSF